MKSYISLETLQHENTMLHRCATWQDVAAYRLVLLRYLRYLQNRPTVVMLCMLDYHYLF